MFVNTVQLRELIPHVMAPRLTPMIHGSPGIGKSDIVRQIAKHFNLELITYILSNRDPVDIIGFPTLVQDKTRSDTAPPLIFPIAGDKLPEGKNGWLLFFDEINSAPAMMQAASYHVILDKMVGNKTLHKNVATIAAGNLDTDNAIVNQLSTAMQSRLIHFKLKVSLDGFLNWGHENNLDYRPLSFVKFQPELLHNFDPDHDDLTFPCPRTWEFTSKIVKPMTEIHQAMLPIIAGTVGEAAAQQFMSYIKIMQLLPTIENILKNPLGIALPNDPSAIHAIGGLISHHLSVENASILLQLIDRFPVEFQIVSIQDAFKRQEDKNLWKCEPMQQWVRKHAAFMIDK